MVTGNYQLVAYPSQWTTMSFDLTVSLALSGTFTPGTPVNLVSAIPGQFSYYSFNAAAGGTYALNFSGVSTNPAGQNLYLSITRPDGSSFNQTFNSNTVVNLTNLSAGTWKVFLVPYYGLAGGATVTLTQAINTPLTVNGAPTHVATTAPAEPATFTFEGTAGTSLQLASTNMVTNPTSVSGVSFNIYAPNGAWVAGFTGNRTSNPGDSVAFNVTQNGTHKVYAQPTGTGTASFDITVSAPITGTIVKGGGPFFVNRALPAQFGMLNFNATSGQNLTINFTSVTTVPANVHLWIDVVNPSGSIIASAHGTAVTRQINLGGLAAGNYKIYIWPTQAVTTSMNIEIP